LVVDDTICGNYENAFWPQASGTGTMIHMADFGWDNRMQSYACGKEVVFDLCNGEPGKDCWNSNGDHGTGPSKNSKVSSWMTTFYGTCKNPKKEPAMIFKHPDCIGDDQIRVDLQDGDRVYLDTEEI
jgi:hypothetical protein